MTATTSTAFDAAFAITVGEEGGYTNISSDPGNWTGGAVGKGTCAGTNWGISAASYPTLNIKALTEAQAQAIYLTDYWAKTSCDVLPPALAMLAFDAAVNNGVSRAKEWVQAAAGVKQDGDIGPITLAAVGAADPVALCLEFQAQRLDFMGLDPDWKTFGLGWSRRLCSTLLASSALVPALTASAPAASGTTTGA